MRFGIIAGSILVLAGCGSSTEPPPPPPPPPALKIIITSPAAGPVANTQNITYSVSGGTTPGTPIVSIDGGAAVASASPYVWVTNTLKNVPHKIKVSVSDAKGATASDSVTVTGSNLFDPDSSYVSAPVSNTMVVFGAGPTWTLTTSSAFSIGLGQTQAKVRKGSIPVDSVQYVSGGARDSGFVRMFVGNSITDRISTLAADSIRLTATATVTGSATKTSDMTIYVQRFDANNLTSAATFASVKYDNLQASPSLGSLASSLRAAPTAGTGGYVLGLSFGLKWRCEAKAVTTVTVSKLSLNFYYAGGTSAVFSSAPFVFPITCPS